MTVDDLARKLREEYPTLRRAKMEDVEGMIYFTLGVFQRFQENGLKVIDYFEDETFKEVIRSYYSDGKG